MATDFHWKHEWAFDTEQIEHIQKLVCHEIHRIRYRLSSAWIPTAEKDALEIELWRLLSIETDINDQL